MRSSIVLAINLLISAASYAGSFEADGFIEEIARKLQSNLPNEAVDGLIQAERKQRNWEYSFWIEAEKTWVTEVKIELTYKNAYKTSVEVEVSKIIGGLISEKREEQSELSNIWSKKIENLLSSPNKANH